MNIFLSSFILGFIAGLMVFVSIFIVLIYFRVLIEQRVKIIEREIRRIGPHVKGAIHLPEDENEVIRRGHIEKNQKAGRDTPIDELR